MVEGDESLDAGSDLVYALECPKEVEERLPGGVGGGIFEAVDVEEVALCLPGLPEIEDPTVLIGGEIFDGLRTVSCCRRGSPGGLKGCPLQILKVMIFDGIEAAS